MPQIPASISREVLKVNRCLYSTRAFYINGSLLTYFFLVVDMSMLTYFVSRERISDECQDLLQDTDSRFVLRAASQQTRFLIFYQLLAGLRQTL